MLAAKRAERPLDVEIQVEPQEPRVGDDVRVRLQLIDPQTGSPKTGLKDVRVLTFLAPGIWQQRQWAAERSEGQYEITFKPREEGLYYIFAEVASAGLRLQKSPFLTVEVKAAPAGRTVHGGIESRARLFLPVQRTDSSAQSVKTP